MDCKKVGNLLFRLRKEMKMTQKQIADKMEISDKTISKWERGLGCPDVSLLSELANILGVNIEKILEGELNENDKEGDNMKKIKFYVCPICGNIISMTNESEVFCCGRKLEMLEIQDEENLMNIEKIENDYYITFSHEMTKEHYISFVAYITYDKILITKLYPEQSPEVRIPNMGKGNIIFYCTQHGLMKHEIK